MGSPFVRGLAWVLASTSGLLLAPRASASVRDPLAVQGLELVDGSIAGPPSRAVWGAAAKIGSRSGALERLRAEVGSAWVAWDDARGCASGIMVSGVDAPGTTSSASRAEAFAQAFVARHLQAIAPGSDAADFVVVANDLSSGIRTIGFAQHAGGVPVLGGQLSVRFAHDRLVYIAASVLPAALLPSHDVGMTVAVARAGANAFVLRDYPGATLDIGGISGRFVLPVWTGAGWRYHDVVRVDVRSSSPLAHWSVYLDATTAAPIAREQLMHDAATVRFDVPVRYPVARHDVPAPQLALTEGGNAALTDLAGAVTLSTSPTTLDLHAAGPLVDVVNNGGAAASASFPAQDGGVVTWSLADDQFGDAQLSAFIHLSEVNAYVRDIAPALDWLDTTVTANVNIDNTCNAVSDGNTLYFFRAGDCENTARIADVVYHEFGHSVHRAAIIPGVGAQSSALSEGISDYLAASMVNDSGMGRGFVFTDAPLRELDPPDYEWTWPQDQGESHNEGRIIGGTLWDLREALRTKLGDEPGRAHADAIWYEAIRRAVDIPTMYPEALVGDDDDGDLSNGTPNVCEINAAFQAHGLLDPSELAELALEVEVVDDGRRISVTQALPVFDGCPVTAADAELRWRVRGAPEQVTAVPMAIEGGAFVATIPDQALGVVVEYQVSIGYSSGASAELPRNQADPWYQLFFGGAQPIYCLDADADLGEWSFAGDGNTWSFGPLATGGVDPGEPYDGDGVLLSQDGIYARNSSSSATGPVIDLAGHQDVRLQFRRWLTVEDATFDQATILANGQPVWRNLASEAGTTQHVDREWVFQDIPLVDALAAGNVQLQLALSSDQGLEFGGWTVDALCVVEVVESWCGDGNLGGDEACDDENNEDGDGCDATCQVEDPDPTGDDGGGSSGDDGTDDGTSLTGVDDSGGVDTNAGSDGTSSGGPAQDGSADGCGCDSRGGGRTLPLLAGLFVLGLRRRARR